MDALSYLLGKKSGGGGGTSDYSQLSNKPSINGVTLSGNKTSEDLGISGESDDILILDYDDTSAETVAKVEKAINSHYKKGLNIIVKRANQSFLNPSDKGLLLYNSIYNQATQFIFQYKGTLNYDDGSYMHFYVNGTWSDNVFTVTNINYQETGISNDRKVLSVANSLSYTPTANYHPATKKYVDDSITNAIGNINTILATLTTPNNGGGN